MNGRCCGNCKFFQPGPPFNECRRNPPDIGRIHLGTGPRTSQAPNGTPVIHIDVRFPPVDPRMWCGEWALRLEIAQSLDDMPVSLPQDNGGRN